MKSELKFPLTKDNFTALRTLLSTHITYSRGEQHQGSLCHPSTPVVLDYSYDNDREEMTITVAKKPMLLPEGLVLNRVKSWLDETLEGRVRESA